MGAKVIDAYDADYDTLMKSIIVNVHLHLNMQLRNIKKRFMTRL